MSQLRVVGAGLGRTGTYSLKIALERLLGAPCYHMAEVFKRPADMDVWRAAANGKLPDWHKLYGGFGATVDWPSAAFWFEIAEAFPDAVILLSHRPADAWWKSATHTIFEGFRRERKPADAPAARPGDQPAGGPADNPAFIPMITDLFSKTFTPSFLDESAAKAAFDRHSADVRQRAPKHRLVEWQAKDGWGPLCAALGVPVPAEPFPLTNTTEEFRARTHLDK
jgi:hypothetical protein